MGNLQDLIVAAVSSPNATPEHISKALDNSDVAVRIAAIENPNASEDNISKALRDKSAAVRCLAINHPKATADHISKALRDLDFNVRIEAIQHKNATKEHIEEVLCLDNPAAMIAKKNMKLKTLGKTNIKKNKVGAGLNENA